MTCNRLAMVTLLVALLTLSTAFVPAEADAPRAHGSWLPLLTPRYTEAARITYYGPKYTRANVCRSGLPYDPEGWFVAVGPSMLAQARALSDEEWPVVAVEIDGWRHALPVWDTGGSYHGVELEVDLPDATWLGLTGQPADAGLVLGRVYVWVGGEAVRW